jgi:uncharacterized protein (TIGR02996 family)
MIPGLPLTPLLSDDPRRDPQETAFLRSIVDNPDDDANRLVYADWLEEYGQPDRARCVRLEVELNRLPRSDPRFASLAAEMEVLDSAFDAQWVWALVRPARVLNCGQPESYDLNLRFNYLCPNRWADLRPTENAAVRYCEECRKKVHYCESKAEAERHALAGDCIAITSRLALAVVAAHTPEPPEEGEMLGMLMPPTEVWGQELFTRRKRWWQFWR